MAPQEAKEKRIEIEKQIEKLREDLKAIQRQCEHEGFLFVNVGNRGYYFCPACEKAIAAHEFLARERVAGVFA